MPTNPLDEEKPHMTIGTWKMYDKYQCNHCPFDSLDRGTTESHIYERHIRPAALEKAAEEQRRSRVLQANLFDADNKKITHIEVAQEPAPTESKLILPYENKDTESQPDN